MFSLEGVPGLQDLNWARFNLWKTSHNWDAKEYEPEPSIPLKIGSWIGHKIVTVITLPVNVVSVGICATGMVLSACTLGAFKVAVFAITLGKKLTYPTGCLTFGKWMLHSIVHIALNTGELVFDVLDPIYQVGRAVKWVAVKLHIDHIIKEVFIHIADFFAFVAEKIAKGWRKAYEAEEAFRFDDDTPIPIRKLNEITKDCRIDLNQEERPLGDILKHYVLSVFNIPLNATAALCSFVASLVLSSIYLVKVGVQATTDLNIAIPTGAGQAIATTFETTRNTFVDLGVDISDVFILMYKTSKALGIYKVMVTTIKVIRFIPEALFGKREEFT